MGAAGDAAAQLVELGLNRNEALAYVSLLENAGPAGATGYEVGTLSGVPRSAVYKILHRLEEMGAVFPIGKDPVRYVPTDPALFLEELRRTFSSRAGRVAESLSRLPVRALPEPIWTVSRYDEVIERADAMIRTAEQSVYLSVWPRELAALMPALASVGGRELHRVLHSPQVVSEAPSHFSVWCGAIGREDLRGQWSHKCLVVVDHRVALLGGAEPEADNHAVYTSNSSLVDVAINHMVLDITLLAADSSRDCRADVSPMMRPHLTDSLQQSAP